MKTPISVSLLLAAALANAGTIYVSPNGSGTQDGSSFDNACAGIAAAYAKASANDTIRLAADTYPISASIAISGNAGVTVLGDPEHPENYILDGSGADTGFFNVSKSVTLRGLTMRNAVAASKEKSALYASSASANVCIDRCHFSSLTNSVGGAAIYSSASSPLIVSNCLFQSCACTADAGKGGAVYADVHSDFVACTFKECEAAYGGAVAGGNRIEKCWFESCRATYGGAFYPSASSCISGCTFMANSASTVKTYGGGAVFVQGNGLVTFEDCVFRTNKSASASAGGAIYSSGGPYSLYRCKFYGNAAGSSGAVSAPYVVEDCVFDGNSATGDGGALSPGHSKYFEDTPRIARTLFVDNSAGSAGGAVYVGIKTNLLIDACSFHGNKSAGNATGGGAFYIKTGDVECRNSLFVANRQEHKGPSAIGAAATMTPIIDNCTFVSNVYAYSAPAYINYHAVLALTPTSTVRNCIFYSNYTLYGSGVKNFYDKQNFDNFTNCASDDDKLASLPNCFKLTAYPFVGGDDFTLKKRAQPIDKGLKLPWMTAEAKDLAGNERVSGATPDLGCCEYVFPGFLLMLR